jgi:hypothetical protein
MSKVLITFSGREHIITDEEAEGLAMAFGSGSLVKLRSGAYVNPSSIEYIGPPPKIPCWQGYPLNKDGRSFWREGALVKLDPDNFNEIEYLPDPKYKRAMVDANKLLK